MLAWHQLPNQNTAVRKSKPFRQNQPLKNLCEVNNH